VMETRARPGADGTSRDGVLEADTSELLFIHWITWITPGITRLVEPRVLPRGGRSRRQIGAILAMLREAGRARLHLRAGDIGSRRQGHNHGKNSLAEIQIPWILQAPA